TEATLRNLNPELRQSITPPGVKAPYILRIPVGTRASFIDRYGRLSSSQKAAVYEYEVQQSDNLSSIAQAFGVSTRTIIAANSLRNPNRIYPGQRLYIPASPNAIGSLKDRSQITYTVRPGDSLSQIARLHGVALNDLMAWNKLDSGLIRPGQQLTIWTQQIPRNPSKPIRLSVNGGATHTVQQGETLWGIARRFKVSVESLRRWNSIDRALIKPGQILVVSEELTDREYTVVTGDTLYSIARKFGLQVEELAQKNNIALTTTLLTGTTLKIPAKADQ
ncbi:MAG: LysM peptidoglycan-binding domain-containing protein, partial [Candidatus Latescibacterota bacterium]